LFLGLLCPGSVFAASTQSVSVSNVPLTIDQSQEFDINILLTCPNCGDSYLRAVFYPSGSSYFGYTKDNNGGLTNLSGGNCTSYLKISQSDLSIEGTWSGKLRAKPDIENAYYKGPGEYLFKVGRYTSSCGSPLWSSETTIAITGPTPTLSPAPTVASTSTPAPIDTSTPTFKPTNTPTQKPTPSISPKITLGTKNVLGESSRSSKIQTPTIEQETKEVPRGGNTNLIAIAMILIGIVFIVACAIVFAYPYLIPYIMKLKKRFIHE